MKLFLQIDIFNAGKWNRDKIPILQENESEKWEKEKDLKEWVWIYFPQIFSMLGNFWLNIVYTYDDSLGSLNNNWTNIGVFVHKFWFYEFLFSLK